MTGPAPRTAPDAVPQTVTVTLTAQDSYRDSWEVFLPDGTWIGTVTRYTGSLDRRVPNGGRHLRQPGKRRTLWSYTTPGERPWNDMVSRADCLRRLYREHRDRR